MDQKWKRTFYRLIDSNDFATSDMADQARSIEETIFLNIKSEVEKEVGREWTGDKEQNSLADFKVAQSLKRSFINYEKSKKAKDPQYFKF